MTRNLIFNIGWGIVGTFVIFLMLVSLGFFDPGPIRALPPDEVCKHKLERIGKAITEYRKENGCLPESVVEKSNGLKHSWRAVITPYLIEQTRLRRTDFRYRFDEPWDTPHNKQKIIDAPLANFTCPLENRDIDCPYVTYVMLVRASSKKAGETKPIMDSLPEDAVLIVESTGCKIEYGQPKDLDMETLFQGDTPFGEGKLNSRHPYFVRALRVDGKVIDIPKNISKEKLKRLLEGKLTVRDKIEMHLFKWVLALAILCALIIGLGIPALLNHRKKNRQENPIF